jgi:hypothetical protein
MGSYLEAYGAGEEQRARRIRVLKRTLIFGSAFVAVALIAYGIFKNHSEEQRVKSFLEALQKKDYAGAYAMWGCTDAHPCRDYSFSRFMDDWGPASPRANAASAKMKASQSCGNGVILEVDYAGAEPVSLFVDRDSKTIAFAPWPECPGRHLHIGAWLRSLFGK